MKYMVLMGLMCCGLPMPAQQSGKKKFDPRKYFVPIDQPEFLAAEEVTELTDKDVVLGLSLNGVARAYPIRYMAFHHICHDRIDDRPLLISYCIMCRSGIAFDTRVQHQGKTMELHFDVLGLTRQAYMMMVDRETESTWPHFMGEADRGPLTGVQMEAIPMTTTSWAHWRELHPHTRVLAPVPKFAKRYALIPAEKGSSGTRFMQAPEKNMMDDRFPPDTLGLGVRVGEDRAFFAYDRLVETEGHGVGKTIGNKKVLVFFNPAHRSAVAFYGEVAGQAITLATSDGAAERFTASDGSVFNFKGECIEGPMTGKHLAAVAESLTVRWYGWSLTYPKTSVL